MLKKVYLELTDKCNLNCIMCYRQTWSGIARDMDYLLLQKCINQIKEIKTIEHIVLGGVGEPAIAPTILNVLDQLQDKYLTITTNGTRDDDEFIKKLISTTNQIVISMDGSSENFEKIRGFSMQKVLDFIDKINLIKTQKFPVIVFQMTLRQDNAEDLADLIKLAAKKKVDKVIISHLSPANEYDSKQIMYTRYENIAGKALAGKINLLSYRYGIEVVIPAMELKTERHCRFVDDNSMIIRADGKIAPCYRLSHNGTEWVFGRKKETNAHFFGDISSENIEEIWRKTEFKIFRNLIRNQNYPSCIDCGLVEGCDMVRNTQIDCNSNMPSCGDCLWARNFIYCI